MPRARRKEKKKPQVEASRLAVELARVDGKLLKHARNAERDTQRWGRFEDGSIAERAYMEQERTGLGEAGGRTRFGAFGFHNEAHLAPLRDTWHKLPQPEKGKGKREEKEEEAKKSQRVFLKSKRRVKVKGHYRNVGGKRVWVEPHYREVSGGQETQAGVPSIRARLEDITRHTRIEVATTDENAPKLDIYTHHPQAGLHRVQWWEDDPPRKRLEVMTTEELLASPLLRGAKVLRLYTASFRPEVLRDVAEQEDKSFILVGKLPPHHGNTVQIETNVRKLTYGTEPAPGMAVIHVLPDGNREEERNTVLLRTLPDYRFLRSKGHSDLEAEFTVVKEQPFEEPPEDPALLFHWRLANFENQAQHAPIEHCMGIDPETGEAVLQLRGKYTGAGGHHIPMGEHHLKRLEGKVFTHNHPDTQTSLSTSDILTMLNWGIAEMRAIGKHPETGEPCVYIARPGKAADVPMRHTPDRIRIVRVLMQQQRENQFSECWLEIEEGSMTEEDAEFLHAHRLNQKLACVLGIEYEVRPL